MPYLFFVKWNIKDFRDNASSLLQVLLLNHNFLLQKYLCINGASAATNMADMNQVVPVSKPLGNGTK